MLFFLWGVFRGRREEFPESLKKVMSNLDVVHMDRPNSSAVMSIYGNSSLVGAVDKETSTSDDSSEEVPGSDASIKQRIQPNLDIDKKVSTLLSSSKRQDSVFNSKSWSKSSTKSHLFCNESSCTSPCTEEVGLVKCKPNVEFSRSSTQSTGTVSSPNGMEEMQINRNVLHHEDDASPSTQDACGRVDIGKTRDGISCDRVKLEMDLNEDIENSETEGPLRDLNSEGSHSWQTSRKRQYLDLPDAVHQTYASTSDKLQLGKVASMLTDSENNSKKLKTSFSGLFGSSGSRDGIILGNKLASPACELASVSSFEENSIEKVGTDERYFFPVDLHNRKDPCLKGNTVFWKENSSDDVNQFCDGVPNLELALGVETKSTNKNKSHITPHNTMTCKEEENGDSAYLSLSLSFPFPDKDRTREPALSREQLLPERCHVNGSLFLFGGFSDK